MSCSSRAEPVRPAPVRAAAGAARSGGPASSPRRRTRRELLALERQLGLRRAGPARWPAAGSSAYTPPEHAAHPLEQLGVGELGGEELGDRPGVVQLQPGEVAVLARRSAAGSGRAAICWSPICDVLAREARAGAATPARGARSWPPPGRSGSSRRGRAGQRRQPGARSRRERDDGSTRLDALATHRGRLQIAAAEAAELRHFSCALRPPRSARGSGRPGTGRPCRAGVSASARRSRRRRP